MRLLLDANLSPRVGEALRNNGYDAEHVIDHGLLSASDEEIFDYAAQSELVVVTSDSDFSALLVSRRAATPSIVQLRRVADLPSHAHIDLLLANLPQVIVDLEHGAIVSLSPVRLAIRTLPIG